MSLAHIYKQMLVNFQIYGTLLPSMSNFLEGQIYPVSSTLKLSTTGVGKQQ